MDKFSTHYFVKKLNLSYAALMILFLLGVHSVQAQYCTSNANSTADEDIAAVYLKGNTVTLNNVSPTPTCQTYTNWTSLPAVDLSAGSTYTISITESTCNGHYTYRCLAWIDYDRNNAFSAAEAVAATAQAKSGANQVFTYTWKVPCNINPGRTRMRIVMIEGALNNPGNACGTYTWGETEDYSVDLQLPTSVSASFAAPSQAFVKAVVKFINNNQSGYIQHSWDAKADGIIEAPNSLNFNYAFTDTGIQCVKLKSTNCLGSDSLVQCLRIKAPTAIPTVDFVANDLTIEQYEDIQLYDLSTNGPWEWEWDVYDSTTYASTGFYPSLTSGEVYSDPFGLGNDEFSQNPQFAFDEPGCYTVVLKARNDVGQSVPGKKVCYITVTMPTQYILGFGTYGPNNDNVVGSASGTIFDNGGPNLPYGNGQGLGSRSNLLITPCNAKKIELVMSRLKFKDAGDVLRVWDGKSPGGPGTTLLASWSVGAKAPQKVTATSGSMYILFESDAGGTDSGFAGSYTSELGPATAPTPTFVPSSTPSYNGTPIVFTNTTANIVGVPTFEWTIDGSQVANNTSKDFRHTFYTDGVYEICLEVKSCVGSKKSCDSITVTTPNTTTSLDVVASNRRPTVNKDIVALKAISDNANRFEWSIFPTTYTLVNPPASPSAYGPGYVRYGATPGDSIPVPHVKFTNSGCYTITLKAFNNNDTQATEKIVVKNRFICVLDYCSPTSYILSTDVGINRVIILDDTTELLNNYSSSGDKAYTDYSPELRASLTYGKTYTLEVSRSNNVDPANRKAWIDWNIDGDFSDANEQIFFEPSSYNQTYTTTFTVPALSQSFEGLTRLRVAANYHNEITTDCGPVTAGEYEDYGLILGNDNMRPVITLTGNDTVRIEVGSSYSDAGATAFDGSEGDITPAIVTTNDLDANTPGLYSYEYNVTDKSGNPAQTVTRTIIVVNDLTNPVLTLNPGAAGCIEARRDNLPYVDPGATATDNKAPFNLNSAIVTSGSVDTRTIGNYVITYTVQDVAGNKVSTTRNVCVADTKAPAIDTLGDARVQIGSVWFDQTVANDAYDNNPVLIREWGFNGPVNTLQRASYPLVYKAIDQSGNDSVLARTYRVDDYIAPVISLNTFDVVKHEVRTPYNSVAATVSDNYYGVGQVSLVRISSNVNANVLGTYSEVFEAVDGSGNRTQKTRTVIVEDTEAPRIWGEIIHGCVGENIWPMWGISTSDNYYGPADLKPLVEIVNQDVNIWEEGIYSITYRVTDPSGNTSEEFTRMVYLTYWPRCFNSTVSVDQVKSIEESVSVYPNPSNGVVHIDLNGSVARNAGIEVYNAMGQVVLSKQFSETAAQFEIDLSGNAAGVYTIRLSADGQTVTKRVVIQ